MISNFEVVKTFLQFRCEFAVYKKESGTSICYVTNKEVGDFLVAALDFFKDSGEMDKYLEKNKDS